MISMSLLFFTLTSLVVFCSVWEWFVKLFLVLKGNIP